MVAGLLSSFIWFILIFLGLSFVIAGSNTENVNYSLITEVSISGLVLFIIGSIFITRFFIKLPARKLKIFAHRSDFLILNYRKDFNIKGIHDSHIYGLTYDECNCKLMIYGVFNYDISFIENVEYFEIVDKYSKSRNSNNFEYCLFERKNE